MYVYACVHVSVSMCVRVLHACDRRRPSDRRRRPGNYLAHTWCYSVVQPTYTYVVALLWCYGVVQPTYTCVVALAWCYGVV